MKHPTPRSGDLAQLAEEILSSMRGDLVEFLRMQEQATSSLDYENGILDLSKSFAQKVTIHQAGPLPKSRNSQKKS